MLAFFDLYSGASGDMILGALLDAGVPLSDLQEGLTTLPIHGYRISAETVMKGAIGATAFRVAVDSEQPPRHLGDIVEIIDRSRLPVRVRERAIEVFTVLGRAEARVHRVPEEEVHFHEVGAIDSIVDIVGACLALHLLDVENVYSSAFPVELGSVESAHGRLPMPGPATLEILSSARAPVVGPPTVTASELVTPTGAALICTLASFQLPSFTVHTIGYGAGRRDLPHPNVIRVWLGQAALDSSENPPAGTQQLTLLETNIDDMNPQVYGYLYERLLGSGALDVVSTPVLMKKNRPGTVLSVLCRDADSARLTDLLFAETTTMGVRRQTVQRVTAEREVREVETPLGLVRVKLKRLNGAIVRISPEYEDCAALARRHDRPLIEVLALAESSAGWLMREETKE